MLGGNGESERSAGDVIAIGPPVVVGLSPK